MIPPQINKHSLYFTLKYGEALINTHTCFIFLLITAHRFPAIIKFYNVRQILRNVLICKMWLDKNVFILKIKAY